jgi:hypothetical protein
VMPWQKSKLRSSKVFQFLRESRMSVEAQSINPHREKLFAIPKARGVLRAIEASVLNRI